MSEHNVLIPLKQYNKFKRQAKRILQLEALTTDQAIIINKIREYAETRGSRYNAIIRIISEEDV